MQTSIRLLAPVLALAACASASRAPSTTASPAPVAKRPVTLTYLGVAGWQISDGEHTVLVDPYFSRPDLSKDGPLVPDAEAIAAHAPAKADLILVGHSHFDHALDVAEVAKRTGAQVMGTISTARLARAGGVPTDRIIPVKGGEDYAFDGFSVRVVPSLHSAIGGPYILGTPTEIPDGVTLPMPANGYAEGGALAYLVRMGGHQVFVLGTASFIEREVEGLRPDVAIVATGLREKVTDYTCRLMRGLGAAPLVLLDHFDNYKVPAKGALAGLDAESRASTEAFLGEVKACAPATRVIIPEHFTPIRWP